MMTMTTSRVTYLYDLMDAACDAAAIRQQSVQLGHRPLTDHPKRYRKTGERKLPLRKNSRSWKRVIEKELRAEEMTWAEQDRFPGGTGLTAKRACFSTVQPPQRRVRLSFHGRARRGQN
jgi:hypothetical protein